MTITEWGTDYWGDILSEPSEGHAREVASSTGATVYVRSSGGEWIPLPNKAEV